MTIIEFLDSVSIHNALSTLLLSPERLVLLGADAVQLDACKSRMEKIILSQHLPTRVEVVVCAGKYPALIKALERILATYPDCAFDVTGGQDEMLVAMGVLSRKYGIPMHTVDPAFHTLSPLDEGMAYPLPRSPRLSVSENITLYGGRITGSFTPPPSTDFWADVLDVWSVAKQDCGAWNTAISSLHHFVRPEDASVSLSRETVENKLSEKKAEALFFVLHALRDVGALTEYAEDSTHISFSYKSYAVQYALEKEGTALELYTYYAAYVYPGRDNRLFTDGKVGVTMDWDNLMASYWKEDVLNEIDVFLMRGITPIFISCKNGFVDADELYKLSVVADRFGGPYAERMIVLTQHRPDASFLNRAKELSIRVIQNVHDIPTISFLGQLTGSDIE